jgi:excisionase family DNA binding protein
MSEKLTLTVEEAGKLLGISRNTAYQAASDGTIPTIRLARRLVVPRVALMRMLENAGRKPRDPETT